MTSVTAPTSLSPFINARQRLASCNHQSKGKHYLHMVTNANSHKIKANSLPSILDSENDYDEENDNDNDSDRKEDVNKSPLSTASCGKKKSRKPWRYLHRQRTTGEMDMRRSESKDSEERNGFNGVSIFIFISFI